MSNFRLSWRLCCAPAAIALSFGACFARAQEVSSSVDLPDAPSFVVSAPATEGEAQAAIPATPNVAKKYAATIAPGQSAVPLSAGDKVMYSFRLQARALALASSLFSAGYGHLDDSRPHFGTDKAGFGERLGNAALRRTTANVIGYGMVAPILHEDPRYYRLGNQEKLKRRALYSVSRIVITRTDSGKSTINAAQLIGIAASQSLVQLYYPTRDRGADRVITSTLSSYATTAGLYAVREFLPDITARLRHKK